MAIPTPAAVGLTVQDADLYGNGVGIDLEASNDDASITDSTIHGSAGAGGDGGIYIAANNPMVSGNTIYGNEGSGVETVFGQYPTISDNVVYDNSGIGITVAQSNDGLISGNDVFSNDGGIDVDIFGVSGSGDRFVVMDSQVRDNLGYGIDVDSDYPPDEIELSVLGNTVFGNQGTGIRVGDYIEVLDNIVYDNVDGILQEANFDGFDMFGNPVYDATADTIDGNRVFGNTNVGISALADSTMVDNDVYSNSIGIEGTEYYYTPGQYIPVTLPFDGSILNNVVDSNASAGILITGASGAQVTNNTVYEPEGDGVRVEDAASSGDSSQNVVLRNNILWTQSGYDISVANDCQQGFSSNYNLLYATGTGDIGYWQTSLADLGDWKAATGFDAQSITAEP